MTQARSLTRIIEIADGFWNIRGPFKVAGLVDLGTHSSLVRLKSGRFVLLDALKLDGDAAQQVMTLTDHGRTLDAVINLHPFHTVSVRAVASMFPKAKLYGTQRHAERAPELPWQPERTDSPDLHQMFADDFDFSVPTGVDFIPANENLHFASVLAIHRPSQTLHVDDTLLWVNLPFVRRLIFHPTLAMVLKREAGAADAFLQWTEQLIEQCGQVEHLCTAHGPKLPPRAGDRSSVAQLVREARDRVQRTITKHRTRFG